MQSADRHNAIKTCKRCRRQRRVHTHHPADKMPARRMASQPHGPAGNVGKCVYSGHHFTGDLCNARVRCQRIADHGNSPSLCRCAAGKMREVIFGKGQPIAAMDDDEETLFRARSAIGPEQIIALARRRSIGLVECRVGGVATEGG